MRHYFIDRQNRPELTLFMAGWGMDEQPFADYRVQDSDLLICYDYRTLDFDYSLLDSYRRIRLVAWSMGVWASSVTFKDTRLPFGDRIAINGTPFPVDNGRGIPVPIFNGTLEKLNDATLRKFLRRMCGSSASFTDFLTHRPQRAVEELKEELERIGTTAAEHPATDFKWTQAIIGEDDLIFPADNQQHAWESLSVLTVTEPIAHYDSQWLRKTVCNPTADVWTKK